MAIIRTDDSYYKAIAAKIREKTGLETTYKPSEMVNGIEEVYNAGCSQAGDVAVAEEKDVNFWDYDGKLLYSYTLEEAQALTELPAAPRAPHELLTFTNWNWSLDNIKAYNAPLDVGAIYSTKNNATYIFLSIHSDALLEVPLYFILNTNSSVEIDWGDGNAETLEGTGKMNLSHTYTDKGRYVIKMTSLSGKFCLGWNDGTNSLLGPIGDAYVSLHSIVDTVFVGAATLGQSAFYRMQGLTKISLSESTIAGKYAYEFSNCKVLKHINLPRATTYLGNLYFQQCFGLALVVTGDALTSTSANTCNNCYSLRRTFASNGGTVIGYGRYYYAYSVKSVYIEDTVTTIGGAAFAALNGVAELEIPASVITISDSAFTGMSSLKKAVFKPTTPPTVSNANAFNNWPADCIVEVPNGCLVTYQNATNYANIASRMVEATV